MIDFLDQVKFWGLTALFNPVFLFLLLVLYFAGKMLGKLSLRMNIWKFLLLAWFAIFLIQPLREAGWFIGGVFLLGFFSNHIARLPDILSWAGGLGDIWFAYKYKRAYEDIRAQEREMDERQRREREQAARQNTGKSGTQERWRDDARRHRDQGFTSGDQHSRGRDGYGYSADNDHARFNPQQSAKAEPRANTIRDKHLQTLGLKPGRKYSLHEIKKAYRKRVIETHPDRGGSEHELRQVMNAWEWLKGSDS